MIYSAVTVTGGSWKTEVRWNITCNGTEYVNDTVGRAPYNNARMGLPACSSCVLNMRDTANDGWSGNYFTGFGLRETMSGVSSQKSFNTICTSNASNTTMISSNVTVNGGTWQSEVNWNITCGDVQYAVGGAPFSDSATIPSCSSCVLGMNDNAGDGWSGNYFNGFGLRETMTGRSRSVAFNSQCSDNQTASEVAGGAVVNNTVSSLVSVGGD